jgi:hypothetical protein
MADRRRAPCLGRESLAERGLGRGTEDLHGDIALEPEVARPPHFSRATAIDALDEAIPAGDQTAAPVRVSVARRAGWVLVIGHASKPGNSGAAP